MFMIITESYLLKNCLEYYKIVSHPPVKNDYYSLTVTAASIHHIYILIKVQQALNSLH